MRGQSMFTCYNSLETTPYPACFCLAVKRQGPGSAGKGHVLVHVSTISWTMNNSYAVTLFKLWLHLLISKHLSDMS